MHFWIVYFFIFSSSTSTIFLRLWFVQNFFLLQAPPFYVNLSTCRCLQAQVDMFHASYKNITHKEICLCCPSLIHNISRSALKLDARLHERSRLFFQLNVDNHVLIGTEEFMDSETIVDCLYLKLLLNTIMKCFLLLPKLKYKTCRRSANNCRVELLKFLQY